MEFSINHVTPVAGSSPDTSGGMICMSCIHPDCTTIVR